MVEPLVAAASVTMTAPFWAPLFAVPAIVGVAAVFEDADWELWNQYLLF